MTSRPIVFALLWLLAAADAGEPPEMTRAHAASKPLHPDDARLMRLIGESRHEDAGRLSGERLASRPRSCVTYALAVEVSRRQGRLRDLVRQLTDERVQRLDDPFLLYGLSAALAELGEDRRSLNLFAAAVGSRSPCAGAYRGFLSSSRNQGKLPEARYVLEKAAIEEPQNPHLRFALGLIDEMEGDARRAKARYLQAVTNTAPRAGTYLRLAELVLRNGDMEESLKVASQGLSVVRAMPDPSVEARLLHLSGRAHHLLGRSDRAAARFEQALAVAEGFGLTPLVAELLLVEANLAAASGDRGRRDALVKRAESIDPRKWSQTDQAELLHRLATLFLGIGQHERGTAYLERALARAIQAREPFLELELRLQRLYLWMGLGESSQALEEGESILRRAIDLRDGDRQGRILAAIAAIYERMGSYPRSLEYYRQALRWAERGGDRHAQALTLGNIALVFLRMGLSGPALAHASQGLELARPFRDLRLQASLHQSLAAALAGLGDFARADAIYQEAMRAASRVASPELSALIESGWGRVLLASGQAEAARARFESALRFARAGENALLHLQALSGLALVDWQAGELRVALGRLEQSLALAEATRRSIRTESDRLSYWEARSQISSNLVMILTELDLRDPDAGFRRRAIEVLERARARSLLDVLARPQELSGSAHFLREGRIPQVEEIQQSVLRPGEVLVEFEVGERRSTGFLLSRDELLWFPLPAGQEIERSVDRFLDSVRAPPQAPANPFGGHQQRGRELYELLLGSIREKLKEASHLIVSPDGVLHRVPFEALVDESRYLVETISISYTPSAAVLAHVRRRARRSGARWDFIGFAQPSPSLSPDLEASLGSIRPADIPFAAEEIRRVGGLFPPDRRRLFAGGLTTERAIKAMPLERYRILHLAAHGLADERFPLRSALLVGTDRQSEEDGVLTMAEVLRLTLDADLVVLSGCETGRGRLLRTEGTLGFTWGFLYAGAASVAVTLWNVNDRATAEMMHRFYRSAIDGASFAQALAESKRAMLSARRPAYRHPYYWAPFVLVGWSEL